MRLTKKKIGGSNGIPTLPFPPGLNNPYQPPEPDSPDSPTLEDRHHNEMAVSAQLQDIEYQKYLDEVYQYHLSYMLKKLKAEGKRPMETIKLKYYEAINTFLALNTKIFLKYFQGEYNLRYIPHPNIANIGTVLGGRGSFPVYYHQKFHKRYKSRQIIAEECYNLLFNNPRNMRILELDQIHRNPKKQNLKEGHMRDYCIEFLTEVAKSIEQYFKNSESVVRTQLRVGKLSKKKNNKKQKAKSKKQKAKSKKQKVKSKKQKIKNKK